MAQVTKKFGKTKKETLLTELKENLTRAKAVVLADYTGLTHKQLEEIRRLIKKAEAKLTVTKNSLLKKALTETHKIIAEADLTGATLTLFAYADEILPIKTLVKFFKDTTKGRVKAGLLGNQTMTASEVEKLSTLPSRQLLLANLVRGLQAPITGLHNALSWNIRQLVWTLDAVKSNKSDTAVSS